MTEREYKMIKTTKV